MRRALATLPWVEQDKIAFDFKKQTITFGYKRPEDYRAEAVVEALRMIGKFKNASELERK